MIEARIYDATAKRLSRRRVPTLEVLRRVVDEIERAKSGEIAPGLSTGFPSIDGLLQLYRGEFTILAGRPSMGKSTLAANIAEAVLHADPEAVVAIGSLEQPADMHVLRMLCGWTGVPYSLLRQGTIDDISRLVAARERIARIAPRLVIDDTPSVSVAHFSSFLRRVRRDHGRLDLAIFDHAHLAAYSSRQTNENTGLTEVSHALKAIPKIHDCPLLGLCQLNRSIEDRTDQHPRRNDLRGSGSFEQDADNILFITRPAMWSNAPKNEAGQPVDASRLGEFGSLDKCPVLRDDEAHVELSKSRNGPLGRVSLRFVGAEFRLYDGPQPWRRIGGVM